MNHNIPDKANRVLNIIILGLLLILVRVWYLAVIQHDEHLEKARRPKRRTVIEKPERATIRDRFNIPLALNRIQYNAAVCYADIRQIPTNQWETDTLGKRFRVPSRSNYIKKLSIQLASDLQLDAQMIEDTIHGKASLFPHTPFILKENLSEEEYHRLKMMEKDWVGIRTERGSRRHYPLGRIGSDVIGYMGAISSREYQAIADEIKVLQAYLARREMGEVAVLPRGFQNPLEVREKLKNLQERAYTINDLVGKAGAEGAFDADLRGYAAKKTCEVDTRGNFLRELPGGRKEVPGQRLLLSISSELQEYAEELLIKNEVVREMRHPNGDLNLSTPWIRGGAIVALDPKTGEILALASCPRFDPNDFISSRLSNPGAGKTAKVNKWLENEACISEIWDGFRPLERERYDDAKAHFYDENLALSLEIWLATILAPNSRIGQAVHTLSNLNAALSFQEEMNTLLKLSGQPHMHTLIETLFSEDPHRPSRMAVDAEEKKTAQEQLMKNALAVSVSRKKIDPILGPISCNHDKLLLVDMCRMLASLELFSPDLREYANTLSLSEYRLLNQSSSIIKSCLCAHAKTWFHDLDFQTWRVSSFKEYLKTKRKEEKDKKEYAKPYTDYLEQMEREMFRTFWNNHCETLLHAFVMGKEGDPNDEPWLNASLKLRESSPEIAFHAERLKNAIAGLKPDVGKKFLKTMRSFHELDRPLLGHYRSLRTAKGVQLEKHLAAAFYPLSGYGYGRSQAFRQSTPQGSVFKIVVAYQALLERYQYLKTQQLEIEDLNPLSLIDHLKWHPVPGSGEQILGYTLGGQPITRLYKGGKLPRSHPNIGKIDVTGAIEQSSNMYFSILAAEQIADPLNLVQCAREFGFGERTGIELPGEIRGILPDDVSHNRTGLYAFAIGQHSLVVTPLQTAVMLAAIANGGKVLKPKIIQVIAGLEPLREYRDPFSLATPFRFKDTLASIGIHFPLFTSLQPEDSNPHVWYSTPEIRRELLMPDVIRDPIIEGMHRVITGKKGTAHPNIIRALAQNPQWKLDYQNLKDCLIGKTGTAEILYKQTIDAESEAKIHNHIWFGGIAFSNETPQPLENPELVVVVYLRFSEAGGKEAAPLAVEIVRKWRELCQSHGKSAAYMVHPKSS